MEEENKKNGVSCLTIIVIVIVWGLLGRACDAITGNGTDYDESEQIWKKD